MVASNTCSVISYGKAGIAETAAAKNRVHKDHIALSTSFNSGKRSLPALKGQQRGQPTTFPRGADDVCPEGAFI